MDATAVTLCKENAIPVLVFDIMTPGNIRRAVLGEAVGTLVGGGEEGGAAAAAAHAGNGNGGAPAAAAR